MPKGTGRRVERSAVAQPAVLGWETAAGPQYARCKSVDVSPTGIQLETPVEVPRLHVVSIRVDSLNIYCRGTVRHCIRKGLKYRVGVEFSSPVKLPTVPVA